MSTSQDMVKTSPDFKAYCAKYFDYVSELMKQLDTSVLDRVVSELIAAQKADNTIFIAGNGGSAATASHMANDLGVGVLKEGVWTKPFRALALTDNNSVMTAVSNDDGYENLFVTQLKMHYRKGDKLIAISASGNSPNVMAAARWVKEHGGKVIGLVGFDGGKLKDIADVSVLVKTPKGDYGPVEDVHMIIDHLIAVWLQNIGI